MSIMMRHCDEDIAMAKVLYPHELWAYFSQDAQRFEVNICWPVVLAVDAGRRRM